VGRGRWRSVDHAVERVSAKWTASNTVVLPESLSPNEDVKPIAEVKVEMLEYPKVLDVDLLQHWRYR